MVKGKKRVFGPFWHTKHTVLSIFCPNMKDMTDNDGFLALFGQFFKKR